MLDLILPLLLMEINNMKLSVKEFKRKIQDLPSDTIVYSELPNR